MNNQFLNPYDYTLKYPQEGEEYFLDGKKFMAFRAMENIHVEKCNCECKCCCPTINIIHDRYVIGYFEDKTAIRLKVGTTTGNFLAINNITIKYYGEEIPIRDILNREYELESQKYNYSSGFIPEKLDWLDRFFNWIAGI